jgi:WD40 repeat protein
MSCAHPRITSPPRPTGARASASASGDGMVLLWDPGGDQSPHIVKGHRNGVGAVAFALDGRTLASAGEEFAGMEADRPADFRDVSLVVSEARSAPAQDWGRFPGRPAPYRIATLPGRESLSITARAPRPSSSPICGEP